MTDPTRDNSNLFQNTPMATLHFISFEQTIIFFNCFIVSIYGGNILSKFPPIFFNNYLAFHLLFPHTHPSLSFRHAKRLFFFFSFLFYENKVSGKNYLTWKSVWIATKGNFWQNSVKYKLDGRWGRSEQNKTATHL